MTAVTARYIRIGFSGLGILLFLIPFVFRWYVSDAARYAALLRSPAPWGYMGNLAYQLLGTIVTPALLAGSCLLVTYSLKDQVRFDHVPLTRRTIILQLVAVTITAFILATVIVVFRTAPTT